MNRNKFTWLVYVIIGLGVFGLATQLFSNPGNLLKNLFLMVVFGGIVFAAIYFIFLRRRPKSNEMKKYKMAVKQSRAKYNNDNEGNKSHPSPSKRRLKRRASHLRVIDGNKSKRKNRTNF